MHFDLSQVIMGGLVSRKTWQVSVLSKCQKCTLHLSQVIMGGLVSEV